MSLTPAQIKPKSFEPRRNSFFTPGGCASCLRACLGARLLLQSYQYPHLSDGADHVGDQLRGDKECPFSGVTKSGRVWRKVPESDVRSMSPDLTVQRYYFYLHRLADNYDGTYPPPHPHPTPLSLLLHFCHPRPLFLF